MTDPGILSESRGPAEVYDECFVPALFAQWGEVVAESAGIETGQRVLDVACGTGALACAVADRVGVNGSVTGLDPNEEMLAVARRKRSTITWRDGRAESLPFPDKTFDAVVSQFGLMFFEDGIAALREMLRVLRPGGRMAVAVCDAVEHSPGYSALADLLKRLFGEKVADAFRAPFVLGDPGKLRALFDGARVTGAKIMRHEGVVRFASIASLISTERACVWTLGGILDESQFERLLQAAELALQPFVTGDGTVAFTMPALIVTALKS
jgi:SAM-dependent methyltransferase